MQFLQKQKDIPSQKDMEKLMEQSDEDIYENDQEKKQFSKMIHTLLVNSYMSGQKTAEVQGTKKDKMFLMILIDTAMSGVAAGAIILYLFM